MESVTYFYNSINHMNYDNITFDSLLNKVIQFLYVELDLPLIKLAKIKIILKI